MIVAELTFWPNLLTPRGTRVSMPWGRLFTQFSNWREFAGDNQHPGWSAGIFDPPQRGLGQVKQMSALVLDYDDGTPIDDVAKKWTGNYGLIHTTRKHQPGKPRCRVILPFARLISIDEYTHVWARRTPYNTDQATKDASRFWFVPGSPHEGTFEARWLEGPPLDVDAILAEAAPAQAESPRAVPAVDAEKRASAYIAKMPPAISGSKGHFALWAVAVAAVCGFGLSPAVAFDLIKREYSPRCSPPWRDFEIRHKVNDAHQKSRVPSGYKLDEGRDWNRTSTSVPRSDPDADPRESDETINTEPTAERGDAWEPSDDSEPPHEAPPSALETKPTAVDPIQKYAVRSVAELLNGVFVRASTEKPGFGCPSGFATIDKLLGGFRRGMVTILGASTSWGKSSFALRTASACSEVGKRVILVSGEDTEDTYGARIMAKRANVSALSIRDNQLDYKELSRMSAAVQDAEQDPFFVNGIGKTAEELAEAIRLICAKRDIDLVIVDYLQAFSCSRRCQDRRVELGHIARCFIEAIKISGSSGLVLSQLKRLENNKPASMSDLKESGDLENMAEHVIVGWIERDKPDDEDSDNWHRFLAVEKNKDGPRLPKPQELEFDNRTASFTGNVTYAKQRYGSK